MHVRYYKGGEELSNKSETALPSTHTRLGIFLFSPNRLENLDGDIDYLESLVLGRSRLNVAMVYLKILKIKT